MILWINGAFGSGKTTAALELQRRIKDCQTFIYDSENAGYFIRENSPETSGLKSGDFQDIKFWREMNYKMLKLISENFDGIIIVPMTLVNSQYYEEIVGRLIHDGIEIRHFILYAGKETILKRLSKREFKSIKKLNKENGFGVNSIDRCIDFFDNHIKDEKIITDNKNIDDIVAEIAEKSNIKLSVDKRSGIRKFFDRTYIFLKHIR